MKSYLSLIPISSKVHKRQNRMTLVCIIIAVFLVTTVFSLADMSVRMEKIRQINKQGNWHIKIEHLLESSAKQIKSQSDVANISWHAVLNEDTEEPYYINDKKAVLSGTDNIFMTEIMNGLKEGTYPVHDKEIMLSSNAKSVWGIKIGDSVTVNTPAGSMDFNVSGFGEIDTIYANQNYVISAFVNPQAFIKICKLDSSKKITQAYYVQFKNHTNISKAIQNIKEQYDLTDQNIIENTGLLSTMGFSQNTTMKNFYSIAILLFFLILIAGVLMISSSINSNVAQRTKFFGMMRCIGASKQQIIKFVRLEALNWCKTAIPIGIVLGTLVTWGLCAFMHFGIGGEFADIPLWGISMIGMISGAIVGIVTVLLAAQAPAKHAAKLSPVAAISGNTQHKKIANHKVNAQLAKIETVLGIQHAVSAKKNLVLMTGSFALSIILILCFSTGLDLVKSILPSIRPWQPDISINGYSNACSIDKELVEEMGKLSSVQQTFGNMYAGSVPVSSNKGVTSVDIVSYDEYMLSCAKKSVVDGNVSRVSQDGAYVLTINNKDNPLKVNDKINVNGTELTVAGTLSDGVFSEGITIICSEKVFTQLTGEHRYAFVGVKLKRNPVDGDITTIKALAGHDNIFSDLRESNRASNATYWSFRLIVYSFLMIIAMITVLNIMNSTSMSVSARMKQYGAMRAVGMDVRQLTKMVATEVFTYVLSGCVIGFSVGLLLNYFLFTKFITTHFGSVWSAPIIEVLIIIILVLASAALAVYYPSKRIKKMAVTDTINDL